MRRIVVGSVLLGVAGTLAGNLLLTQLVHPAFALTPAPVAEQNLDANGQIRMHEQGTANVRVTNTSPIPVTAQGTSSVSGTVNVGNTPSVNAQQSGPWTVGLSGSANTVKIDPAGNTVQVVQGQPHGFATEVTVRIHDGFSDLACCGFTVPAGKVLQIDFISVRNGGGASLRYATIFTETGGGSGAFNIPVAGLSSDQGASELVKLYADSATNVSFQAGRNGSSGDQNVVFDISGTLY